jgi:hypothetical protein
MNTENNDHQSTVSDILKSQCGESLKNTSLETKLILMEATAFSLRLGIPFTLALDYLLNGKPKSLQDEGPLMDFKDANEGLHIMGLLNEGIVEGYSVLRERKIG